MTDPAEGLRAAHVHGGRVPDGRGLPRSPNGRSDNVSGVGVPSG